MEPVQNNQQIAAGEVFWMVTFLERYTVDVTQIDGEAFRMLGMGKRYFSLFMGILCVWLVAICIFSVTTLAESPFNVLLFGEKVKGIVKIRLADHQHYELKFDFAERPTSLSVSVHTSAVEYTSELRSQQCEQALRSARVSSIDPLSSALVKISELVGHTIVLSDDRQAVAYACGTVLPREIPILKASFHSSDVIGDVHVIQLGDQIRFLSNLHATTQPDDVEDAARNISWAFVENCDTQNVPQSSSDMELRLNEHTTVSLSTAGSNLSLSAFELFLDAKPVACALLKRVKPRLLRAGNRVFEQDHAFSALKGPQSLQQLTIAKSCTADDTTIDGFRGYFPTLTAFGTETILLKKLIENGKCTTILPEFEIHSAVAYFVHPIVGSITLLDVDNVVFLTSSLRTYFDESSSFATVQISPMWVDPTGCQQYLHPCNDCHVGEHAVEVKGRDATQGELSSFRLERFSLQVMRSLIVDLGWAKACANLTQLRDGQLEAVATIRRYSPVSARSVGTFHVLENVLSGRSDVILEHSMGREALVELYQRSVDMSITSGPPCGELTIGSKLHRNWLRLLHDALNSTQPQTRITIDERLITGANSLLGKTVFLSQGVDVACGTISVAGDKAIMGARFEGILKGRIKMVQTLNGPQGLPTEVFYHIEQTNETTAHQREDQQLEWSVVSLMNASCESALIFNPFQYDEKQCESLPEFCAIGDLSTRSAPLELNIRRQMTINNLPLFGPFSVAGRWIRLRMANDATKSKCAPVEEWHEETFRWTALSLRPLSELQNELAHRFDVEPFQVAIDYNRELLGSRCSIYRITLTAPNDVIASATSLLNREQRRFNSDELLRCSNDTSEVDRLTSSSRGAFSCSCLSYGCLLLVAFAVLFARH